MGAGAGEGPGPAGCRRRTGQGRDWCRIEQAWYSVPRADWRPTLAEACWPWPTGGSDFGRVFDLAERIIPAEHHGREVASEAAQRELLLLAARAHGIGTADDLADYYRMSIREARPRLDELVEACALQLVKVEGWRQPAYLHPKAVLPSRLDAASLLSPFDPVVWFAPERPGSLTLNTGSRSSCRSRSGDGATMSCRSCLANGLWPDALDLKLVLDSNRSIFDVSPFAMDRQPPRYRIPGATSSKYWP